LPPRSVQLFSSGSDRSDLRAPLDIVSCANCFHLYNQAFDDSLIPQLYGGVKLTNMPVHPSMLTRLAEVVQWLSPALYAGGRVLEIGAGAGHLARLLAADARDVVVCEPCRSLDRSLLPEDNITLINDYFSPGLGVGTFRLVVCRQVIEHLSDPLAFVRSIRAALDADGWAYLEVPNADYILDHAAIFDFMIPHVQYFSRSGFERLLRQAGLESVRQVSIKNGHDFGVLARPIQGPSAPLPPAPADRLATASATFAALLERITALPDLGRAALYGANAHTQSFLELAGGATRFRQVFDDNEVLEGDFVCASTQAVPIVKLSESGLDGIERVVICAYLHDDVIAGRLRSAGFAGDIRTIRRDGSSLAASLFPG